VWTRPEAIVESFARALAYDEADPQQALEETRAYAAAVAAFTRGARATFVPTWTLPPWHRGYGPLDFRPGIGIAHLLARMNVALADALGNVPNVFVLDAARWLTSLGPRAWSDKLWYAARSPFTAAAFEQAAADIGAAIEGLDGGARRIVILDLDDVLWGGMVGEVGWQGLNLGGHDHVGEAHVDFQRALKGLARRGIQLAIVSKNSEAVALEAIDRHPEMQLRREDFAGWSINWKDKADNVLALLADLGFAAESAVFIDDNAIVRRGIASLLAEADGLEVVGEAGDGREAIAKAEELKPDVVCLDVRMPVMDGVAAAGPLAQRSKVLMLSYSEDEHLVTGAIRNGAAGYLVHGRFEPEELEGRIKAVAAGEMVLSPAVTPAVFDVLRRAPGPSNDDDELGLGSLTAREREVLNLLARGNSNREIAEELVITNKTVKNHLSRIYEKIGVHSRAEAIALWLGVRDA